jgi:predicted dehydrogenase
LGPDLLDYLRRLSAFNARAHDPTHWALEIHAGADFWPQALRERPGNLAVLSGRNEAKLERLTALVARGLHVLVDKPWIIESGQLEGLQAALELARRKQVVIYDAMTQRFEITCLLQRELVGDPAIFGTALSGSAAEPAVTLASLHFLYKEVAGSPSLRPASFFDIRQQGEGLADVGTHLVDQVQWILFPEEALDYQRDLQIQSASRWPTWLAQAQFARVTGEPDFPASLAVSVKDRKLAYYANNRVDYTLRGIRVRLETGWDFAAGPGAREMEVAVFRGTRSRVERRPDTADGFLPTLQVVPNTVETQPQVREALTRRLAALRSRYPGLDLREEATRLQIIIPAPLRLSHEAHFTLLTRRFLDYVRHPHTLPAWETPNLLAKYCITTRGVELARHTTPAQPEPSHHP